MPPARTRFGGATAIAIALVVYAAVSIGGGVALGGPADLDTSFDGDGLAQKEVGDLAFAADAALQADGKYVVLGDDGDDNFAVVRFNANGSVDTGFGTNGLATVTFPSMNLADPTLQVHLAPGAIALEGSTTPQKIVIAGSVDQRIAGEQDDFAVARLNANGTLDTNTDSDPGTHFSTDGKLTTDFGTGSDSSPDGAQDVAVLPDGKILAGGFANIINIGAQRRIAFVRYLTDGTLDTTFSGDGRSEQVAPNFASVGRMVVDATGSRITASLDQLNDLAAGRFFLDHPTDGNLDGTFDPAFGGGDGHTEIDFGQSQDSATSLAIQGNGAIVLAGGTFIDSSSGANSDFALVRLDPNGVLDNTFSGDGKQQTSFGPTGFRGSIANDVIVQPGGQIVAAGFTDVCDFSNSFAVARYDANGTLDPTFSGDGKSIAGPVAGRGTNVFAPAAGKLVVAGDERDFPDDLFALAQYGTATPDSNPGFCPTLLTVSLAGSGSGTVTGTGINCPGDCSEGTDPGETSDVIEATPAAGSTFVGWEGNPDCTPANDPECFIDIGTNTTVTARFDTAGTTTTTTTPTTTTTTTPTTTTPAVDTDPPETTITKGPKKKTPKPKAKLTFTSDEPGSTFECALKGKKVKKKLKNFKPCSAKAKYKKLKPGAKQFQVRATDPAGNVDETPAKLKWKVKPKK